MRIREHPERAPRRVLLQYGGSLLAFPAVNQGPMESPPPNVQGASTPARKHPIRRGLLVALLLLVVFHRPLLIALVHAIAVKVAATQNIQLSLRIEGSIFTNLSLLDIHAVPNGRGPTPVEDISIQEITAHYSRRCFTAA